MRAQVKTTFPTNFDVGDGYTECSVLIKNVTKKPPSPYRISVDSYLIRSNRLSGQSDRAALGADDYDDPAFLGGNMERPALKRLMADIEARKIDVIVIYKIDRLTRSLADFSKMVEVFERQGVSFVSVTQQFNTNTSMGRLMLNVLLSFNGWEIQPLEPKHRTVNRPEKTGFP
ncbi:hypothetical protein M2244_001031 [Rhodoferax antarcticus]|nr:hypothetical protein [Rhodoferax antarcticus]